MEKGVEYTTSTQLHVVLLALQLPVLLYLLSGIGSDRVQELFYAVLASVQDYLKYLASLTRSPTSSRSLKLQLLTECYVNLARYSLASATLIICGFRIYQATMKATREEFEDSLVHDMLSVFWEMCALVVLSLLRRNSLTQRGLNVSYAMLMGLLPILVMPQICPPPARPLTVASMWLLRFCLLPLTNCVPLVLVCNVLCHISVHVAMGESISSIWLTGMKVLDGLQHAFPNMTEVYGPRNAISFLRNFLEGCIIFDAAVLLCCAFVSFWLQWILEANVNKAIRAEFIQTERRACASLLATICDAYFFLDADFCLERNELALACMLFHATNNRGTSFLHCLASQEDQDRFVQVATEVAETNAPPALAKVLHLRLRDGVGNVVPVEAFHVKTQLADGQAKHLVGIRDYRDDTFFVRPEERPEVETVEPSSSSESEAEEGAYALFDAMDLEVLNSSRQLLDFLGMGARAASASMSFLELIDASDREFFMSEFMDKVRSCMASTQRVSFDLRFKSRSSRGTVGTAWKFELQTQDNSVMCRATLQGARGKMRKRRSRTSRGSKSGTAKPFSPMQPLPEKLGQCLSRKVSAGLSEQGEKGALQSADFKLCI